MSYNKYNYDKLIWKVIENYTRSAVFIQKWWRYFIQKNKLIGLFVKKIAVNDIRGLLLVPKLYNRITSSVVREDTTEVIIHCFCNYFNEELESDNYETLSDFFDDLYNKLLIQTLILDYRIDLRFRVVIE